MGGYSRLQVKTLAFLVIAFLVGSIIRFWQNRAPLPAVEPGTNAHFQAIAESLNVLQNADSLRARVADENAVMPVVPAPMWIHINTASAEELQSLPGIGPVLARRIVEYRQAHGPFQDVDELVRVRGIGKGMLKRIAGKIAL